MQTIATKAPEIGALFQEAVMLLGMIEGLDVLHDQADGAGEDIVSRRARNALTPSIQAAITMAEALANGLERADMAQRRA